MNWKFWRSKRSPEQIQLDRIQQQLSDIAKQSLVNAEYISSLTEKVNDSSEQIHKWSRFQYRSTQDIQARLEHLEQSLEQAVQWQTQQDGKSDHITDLEARLNNTGLVLIRWLDDIDHLRLKLPEQEQSGWVEMLNQWTEQLLTALTALDIHELDVLHRSFDPRLAESIETIPVAPEELNASIAPFQVVSVIQRGYTLGYHQILRKAKVITLQYNGGENDV